MPGLHPKPQTVVRRIARWLVVALPSLILGVDTAVALFHGWKLQSRLEQLLLGVVGLGWGLGLLALGGPAGWRRHLPRPPQVALAIGATTVAILAVELALQVWCRPWLAPPFHTRPVGTRVARLPLGIDMPGVSGDAHSRVNSLGIRGTEFPEDRQQPRILCLGGSTTECGYLDDLETWPHLIQEMIQQDHHRAVWVGNLGISGFNTRHHLKFIRESPLVEEVDVLVVLAGVNDLLTCLNQDRRPWEETDLDRSPRWSRSLSVQVLRQIPVQWRASRREDLTDRLRERSRREQSGGPFVEQLPDLTTELAAYRRRLQAMIDLAHQRRRTLVFLTQPTLWSDQLPPEVRARFWQGTLGGNRFLSAGCLAEGMRRFNQVLEETCRDAQVQCISLEALNAQPVYFYDHCHFNEAGARAVATLVAPLLATILKTAE